MSWKDEYNGLIPTDAGSIGPEIKGEEQANDQTAEIKRRSNG